jgi:hypothetical protein
MPRTTRQHVEDHLGQAEFALKIASNFDCLRATPAHDSVRAALARVAEARSWIRRNLEEERNGADEHQPARLTAAERHRAVLRKMARIAP